MDIAQSSQTEMRHPAFETGPDGFPQPGQVIRHFRLLMLKPDGKPWTQCDVAQILGKQELAVREMELKDTGLNDITRRRFLAGLFHIPLHLLGLEPLPERQNAISPELTWWVQDGYPAFEAGPDGFPRPGQVIRHFRQKKLKSNGKSWTQSDIALVLGKQELAVREMELKDTGLNDIARRRFLTQLLQIPPLLLGLAPIPTQRNGSVQGKSMPVPKIISSRIDLDEVRDQLAKFWTKNAGNPQHLLVDIDSMLKRLYERYPTVTTGERLEMIITLCELHIHSANILRDRGIFSKSLEHLQKTEMLNTLLQEDELQADIHYRRGGVYSEKGMITLALDDYHAALQMLSQVSPVLQAAILLETSLSEARIATSPQQRTIVLKRLDRAGHLIRGGQTHGGREKWPYLKVDRDRYHLDRSASLIFLGFPKEAQLELSLLSSSLSGRRSIYHQILQAQASFGLKEYAQAATIATDVLPEVRLMYSRVNLERIKRLYKQFQQTPFRNNPEVGRLEYLLFHV